MELSEFHMKQLTQFLAFMRVKRRQHVKEIELEVDILRKAARKENVFNQEDVLRLLADAEEKTRDCVVRELEYNAHVSTLLVKNLFVQAENEGLVLLADTNCLEDAAMILEIARMEEEEISGESSGMGSSNVNMRVVSRGGVGVAHQSNSHLPLPPKESLASMAIRPTSEASADNTEIATLKSKLASAEGKADRLLAELKEGMKDRVDLHNKVMAQETEIKSLRMAKSLSSTAAPTIPLAVSSNLSAPLDVRTSGSTVEETHFRGTVENQHENGSLQPIAQSNLEEIGRLRAHIEELKEHAELRNLELTHAQQQLADSSMEANVKAAQMKQFRQMRDILERKNVKLANFRLRLSRYEVLDLDEAVG